MPLHDVAISTSLSGLSAALLLLLMNSCLSDCVFENESEMEVLTEHYISSVSSPQSYCINSVCAICVLLQLLQYQDDRNQKLWSLLICQEYFICSSLAFLGVRKAPVQTMV